MKIDKTIKRTIYIGLCTIPLIGFISCKKDFLDIEPKTSIFEDDIFGSPGRILGQVNGIYDGLKSGQHRGGRSLIYNDIRGEEFINRTSNSVTGFQTWNYTVNSSSNEIENFWIAAYSTINRVNIFLKKLDENASKVDANLAKQYKAEVKLVRALCYFDLVTLYAKPYTANNGASPGLPLRLKAETTSDNNDLARSTVAEVYNQILADLNEAEANLPLKHGTPILNVTRAHKHTAIALKTRVYLSMGKYPEVITEAQKIVTGTAPSYQAPGSGVAHKLEPNIANVFTSYTTPESIFSLPMTDADAPGTQNQLGHYFNRPGADYGNGEYYLNTKGIIADTAWRKDDDRRAFLVVSGGNTYLSKYSKPAPFTDYVPVIRYAEVLLNYAEAAARTNDLGKALDLLKAVRNRSHKSYEFPPASTNTQTALINTILNERRIELLAEGLRSIDLLRLGQPLPAKSNVGAVQPSERAYIWSIPNAELLTNKKMTQN